jgi:uncharacterized RDD family membrane protein YckC
MPSQLALDFAAIKQGLEQKTSPELLDILSFSQDDYDERIIPIIGDVLLERNVPIEEIIASKNSFKKLKEDIESQPKRYVSAVFWLRALNYIADHFICFGLCLLIRSVQYTFGDLSNYTEHCLLAYILYYGICFGLFDATIGMLIVGLRVINVKTNKPISFFIGLIRGLCMVLNALTLQIGNLMMLWDKNQRTLVDLITDTSVVYK